MFASRHVGRQDGEYWLPSKVQVLRRCHVLVMARRSAPTPTPAPAVEGERAPLWSGALPETLNFYYSNNGSQSEPKVQALGGSEDASVLTFHIAQEDHTLGNVVRYLAGRDKRTQLVGYSVPHPSEHAINMRIQGYETPAVNILEDALTNLIKICDHMMQTFDMEVQKQRAHTTE